jgi:ArsR family transcriptional regulator
MNDLIILKAVADDTRLKIIKLLLLHNYCVGALAKQLDISEAAVSQHIKILKEANLLTGEKRGYFTHYTVNKERLSEISSFFGELVSIERQPNKSCAKGGISDGHCKGHKS